MTKEILDVHADTADSLEDFEIVEVYEDGEIDPEAWRLHADVFDEATVRYLFQYGRLHADDEDVQNKLQGLRGDNESYRLANGKNIPGYDESYFTSIAN